MTDFFIELASKNDVKQINDIVNYYIETSGANWSWEPRTLRNAKKWYRSHSFSMHPIFVARSKNGKVLGFSSLSPFRAKDGYWPVAENSIYVDKKYSNQQIGNKLMEATLSHARASKLEVITAWIDSENKSSISFHVKWGFVKVGEMKNIGDKWNARRSVTIMQISVKKEDI